MKAASDNSSINGAHKKAKCFLYLKGISVNYVLKENMVWKLNFLDHKNSRLRVSFYGSTEQCRSNRCILQQSIKELCP